MATNRRIRVLVVDDSALYRTLISKNLAKNPEIEVVGTAVDGEDAQAKIKTLKPDVVSLDVEMPKMSGIEVTRQILTIAELPIILVSSASLNVFDALQAGAVDFVKKPTVNHAISPEAFINELISKIKIASVAKVHKNIISISTGKSSGTQATPAPTNLSFTGKVCTKGIDECTIIALGASTGGTEATLEVLQRLPEGIPPILIVQHMPAGFTKMYAERLDRLCKIKVKEAENGEVINPGYAYIAPGDAQMIITKAGGVYKLKCEGTQKVSGHCPSVDVLFNSVADIDIKNKIGIILTGMGRDGAEGMLRMKKAGAYNIGENQESCVVYGMPMAAYELGAVNIQAGSKDIANLIMRQLEKLL